jgi:hypothetical protein
MGRFSAVALVLGSVMPFAAGASELKPMQAGTFVLGDQTASVFYTQSGDVFEVVTTIGPTDGSGAPVRLTGFLLPGQKQMVSVGGVRHDDRAAGAGAGAHREGARCPADLAEAGEPVDAGRRTGPDRTSLRGLRPARSTVPAARAWR